MTNPLLLIPATLIFIGLIVAALCGALYVIYYVKNYE